MKKLLIFLCAVTLVLGSMGRVRANSIEGDINRGQKINDVGVDRNKTATPSKDMRNPYFEDMLKLKKMDTFINHRTYTNLRIRYSDSKHIFLERTKNGAKMQNYIPIEDLK